MRDLMRLFRLMAQTQEEVLRSPYADLLLEMAVVRMATLAPVLDGEDLARAVKALGGMPPASSGGPISGPRPPVSVPSQPASAAARRLKIEGEVKADAPLRKATSDAPRPAEPAESARPAPPGDSAGAGVDMPDLRDYIRQKKAALAGFMELGAGLELSGDILRVVPRNDIYVRYLNDNKGAIAALASEHYGRSIKVELTQSAPAAENPAPLQTPAESREKAVTAPAPAASPRIDFQSAMANAAAAPEPAPSNGEPIDRESARKELFADPMVRRILDELEGRLVDVRRPPVKRNEPQ